MKKRKKIIKNSKLPKGGERDALTGTKKVRVKGHWFGAEALNWYMLMGLAIIISILLFPDMLTSPKTYNLGDVATRDVKASYEFLVENTSLTEKNRLEAVKAVLSVYDFDPDATKIVSKIREAFQAGRAYEEKPPQTEDVPDNQIRTIETLRNDFFELLGISANDKMFDLLITKSFPLGGEESIINIVTQVLNNGVVGNKKMLISQSGKGIVLHDILTEKEIKVNDLDHFYDLKSANRFISSQAKILKKSLDSTSLANVSCKLAATLIKPNLTFNKRETELREDLARKSSKPFYFKVKKGEMLVREGERITPEHLLKLSEQYKFLKHRETLGRMPAMAVMVGLFLSVIYLVGLLNNGSSRVRTKDMLFCTITILGIFLVVMASDFVASEIARGFDFFSPRTLVFAIPVAVGAMLISIFHGMSVATCFSLIISVLASLALGGRMEFFIYFFISSLVAANGVKNCRERGLFIKTGVKIGVCNMILALSIEALYGSFYHLGTVISFTSAFIGGILAGVVAAGILPLIEMSFGYTTDIKLLELASLDQPLLRELMVQAPGTYHHSVIVSNMVEASAQAINANPLLAKVAAYYHDIGKVNKPLYFIENQRDLENRHEKLAPSMSSLILISHVKDGVELARKYKLSKEIIDIIKQHHGTSLITFFYEKARELAESKGEKSFQVKEEDFRYRGPKPQTKEAGLVMLADVVEAASKTLVDPTASRIQGMVQKMINKVFFDGQLDECELTLKDLHEIAKSFNMTLSGIFHHRIEYPEASTRLVSARNGAHLDEAAGQNKNGENGDTDHMSEGDPRTKSQEDTAEAGDNLRRLGLS